MPAPAHTHAGPPLLGGLVGGLLVLLLHGALALVLWQLPAWRDRGTPLQERPPMLLRLWWPETAAPVQLPAPIRPKVLRAPPTRGEPQAITVPSTASGPPTAATTGNEATVAPVAGPTTPTQTTPTAAASTPAPLNLSLPRGASAPWRQRTPALDDPRSNTAKLTLEQKLANAMGGDGSWNEERLDLDTVRWRRGNECIVATRSRAGQLELGSNGAFRNSWLVRAC